MTNSLSPSESKEKKLGFTRELLGKLQDMLGHAILKCDSFLQITTEQLDQFVKVMGPGIKEEWLNILMNRLEFFNKSRVVEVDYGGLSEKSQKSVFSEKLKSLRKFTSVLDVEEIDVDCKVGIIKYRVFEICFENGIFFDDLDVAIRRRGRELGFKFLCPVDPPTFVAHVSTFSPRNEDELKSSLATYHLVNCEGKWMVMYGYEKEIAIGLGISGMKFSENTRFLVYSPDHS